MRILLIVEDPELRNLVRHYLNREGHLVESASGLKKASAMVVDYDYDCVVINITHHDEERLDMIRHFREDNKTAIIVISDKELKAESLSPGYDEYLVKPFSPPELGLRIKSLMKRKNFGETRSIRINEMTIVPAERRISVDAELVNLTSKEYELLMFLVANKNKMVSKDAIAEHVWGDESDPVDKRHSIYVHLRNLRRKLSEKGCKDPIQTIYGIGYRLNVYLEAAKKD